MKVLGDWGLGIGDWGLGAIPNPQYPLPNYSFFILNKFIFYYFNKLGINYLFISYLLLKL